VWCAVVVGEFVADVVVPAVVGTFLIAGAAEAGQQLGQAHAAADGASGEPASDTSKDPLSVEDYLKGTTQVSSGKSKQYVKTGDLNDANNDFDRLAAGRNVQDDGDGKRSVKLADGTRIGVRPTSSEGNPATAALPTQAGGSPTIQIDPPKGQGRPIKTRYIP
jgi:hypothetical protein